MNTITSTTIDAAPADEARVGPASDLQVLTIDTANLGDRSYIAAVDGLAVVIDPQRDIDRVLALVDEHQLRIALVVETHIHNDYVTGGLELARVTGAPYVVPGGDTVAYDRLPAHDGSVFPADSTNGQRFAVRSVHTPGHTPHHMSYVAMVDGQDLAVFTGGSMLHGSVGRPDLLGADHTQQLAHDQWHSVRRLATELDGTVDVLPTHGFGSFCSATATTATSSTVADQRLSNPALTLGESAFVEQMLAGLDAFPAYYAHMGPANAAGPAAIDLSLPQRAGSAELRRRLDAGEWVIDLRSREVFARGHLQGSLSFDDDGNAITYLGWLIPWGTPLTLLAATPEDVTAFQRELVRIGIDRPAAFATGSPQEWAGDQVLASFERINFKGLTQQMAKDHNLLVIDARRRTEWLDGHVAGARHLPLHELPARVDEVVTMSRDAEAAGRDPVVRIYCGSGFRAAVAASLLERAGVPVVQVDEDFDKAATSGASIVHEHVETHFGTAVTA